MNKKILCFDFDGVIHSYVSGWQGPCYASDKPVKGIKETIEALKENYKIFVYSSRCKHKDGIKCIERYMQKYGIYYDEISNIKPLAYLTIDDRCICFDGSSTNLLNQISNFSHWHNYKCFHCGKPANIDIKTPHKKLKICENCKINYDKVYESDDDE